MGNGSGHCSKIQRQKVDKDDYLAKNNCYAVYERNSPVGYIHSHD